MIYKGDDPVILGNRTIVYSPFVKRQLYYNWKHRSKGALKHLHFHSSYDKLIPVIQACRRVSPHLYKQYLAAAVSSLDITAMFLATVEFIHAFNEQTHEGQISVPQGETGTGSGEPGRPVSLP